MNVLLLVISVAVALIFGRYIIYLLDFLSAIFPTSIIAIITFAFAVQLLLFVLNRRKSN